MSGLQPDSHQGRGRTFPSRKRGKGGRGGYIQRRSSLQKDSQPNLSRTAGHQESELASSHDCPDSRPNIHGTSRVTSPADDHISRSEYNQVIEQRDNLLERCNTYKSDMMALKTDLTQERVMSKTLREKVIRLEKDLQDAQMQIKNLEGLNLKLVNTDHSLGTKKNQKFILKLQKSLDKKYLSIATTLERRFSDWAQTETMELTNVEDRDTHIPARNWNGRMTITQEHGVPRQDQNGTTYYFVPTEITSVLNSEDVFFIRSFSTYNEIIESIASNLLEESSWKHYAGTDASRLETLQILSSNPVMIGKIKQCLSDSISNRKRLVRDELFQTLGYFSLKTSHDRRREIPLFPKDEEIKLAKEKLLGISSASTSTSPNTSTSPHSDLLDFARWREGIIYNLTSDGSTPDNYDTSESKMDIPVPVGWESDDELDDEEESVSAMRQNENNVTVFGIFRNTFSRRIWTQFIGYDPCVEDGHRMETTIVSITRLNAWFATVLLLLSEQEKRGGGRQRDYNVMFHKNHAAAMNSLINKLFQFVMFWEPGELKVPDVPEGELEHTIKNQTRTATFLLESAIQGNYFIAIQNEWFNKYISSCMGDVHDCYIAKISNDWTEITPLSTEVVQDSRSTGVTEAQAMVNINGGPQPVEQPQRQSESSPRDVPENGFDDDNTPAPATVPPMPQLRQ